MIDPPSQTWRAARFPFGRRLDACFAGEIRGDGVLLVPSLHVMRDDERVEVRAEIPGAEREELEVVIDGRVLRISGERRGHTRVATREVKETAHCLTGFTREILLADAIEPGRAKAHFHNGVLTVLIPRLRGEAAEERARSTEVVSVPIT